MENVLHWADQAAKQVIAHNPNKETYVVASGITPSGIVHAGNFREVITVDFIARALKRAKKKVRFIYSWDDYDPLRKIPKNMPKPEELKTYLGKPISITPDTTGQYASYAEHNEKTFEADLPLLGIYPEFIYQYQNYTSCVYAEGIRTALRARDKIRTILNQYRKETLAEDWFPLSIFCEHCNKNTTKITHYDEEYTVTYTCACKYEAKMNFKEIGRCKLPWRIDWPMRWKHEGVDFESGGKDHFTAGGSVDSASKIMEQIYGGKAPYGFMYEWIGKKGGGEFASSSGNVLTLKDILAVYEPALIRYLFAGTRPSARFNISFDLDVLKIYEDYDKCARIYYGVEEAKNEKDTENQKRIYELSCVDAPAKKLAKQISFRHLTTIVQIYEGNIDATIEFFKNEINTAEDENAMRMRAQCVWNWLDLYAPDMLKFKVVETVLPKIKQTLKANEKTALLAILAALAKTENDQELHQHIYEIAKENLLEPKQLFKQAYMVLIGKERGPRLASFLKTLGLERVKTIFEQIKE